VTMPVQLPEGTEAAAWQDTAPGRSVLAALVLLATNLAAPLEAQVSVLVHGGVHAARLDRPERVLVQPAHGIAVESSAGERPHSGCG
jgi:hypothetical protein